MIEQYLPQTNENTTIPKIQKDFGIKQGLRVYGRAHI